MRPFLMSYAVLLFLAGCAATTTQPTRDAAADSAIDDAGVDGLSADMNSGMDASDATTDACAGAEIPCNNLDDNCDGVVDEVAGDGPLRCLTSQTHALSFDSTQFATVPGSTAFGFPDGNFTIEAWIKMSEIIETYPTIFSTRESGGLTAGILFGITGRTTDGTPLGTAILQLGGTHYSAPAPQADLRDGMWHHVAVTGFGRDLKFYADGILLGTSTLTGTVGSTANVTIGMDPASGPVIGGMRGQICQVRVWEIERSQAEILRDLDRNDISTSGLVAYWPLNEGIGQIINDIAAGNRHSGFLGLDATSELEDAIWVNIGAI